MAKLKKTREEMAAALHAHIARLRGPQQVYIGRLYPGKLVWPADIWAFYEARKARKLLPLARWQLALARLLQRRRDKEEAEKLAA